MSVHLVWLRMIGIIVKIKAFCKMQVKVIVEFHKKYFLAALLFWAADILA